MTIETAPKSNIVIYERRRINQEEKRKIRGKQQDKKSTQQKKRYQYTEAWAGNGISSLHTHICTYSGIKSCHEEEEEEQEAG